MRRFASLLPFPAVALSLCSCVVATGCYRKSVAARRAAGEHLATVTSQVDELNQLRSRVEMVSWSKRPTQSLLSEINSALGEAGIPSDRLQQLSEDGTTDLAPSGNSGSQSSGRKLQQQVVTVSLDGIDLPRVGRFLTGWQAKQSPWKPILLELSHHRDPKAVDLYDLRIALAATYVAD